MMNIGRWDDARESLDKARKAAPRPTISTMRWLRSIASPAKPIPLWPI